MRKSRNLTALPTFSEQFNHDLIEDTLWYSISSSLHSPIFDLVWTSLELNIKCLVFSNIFYKNY